MHFFSKQETGNKEGRKAESEGWKEAGGKEKGRHRKKEEKEEDNQWNKRYINIYLLLYPDPSSGTLGNIFLPLFLVFVQYHGI